MAWTGAASGIKQAGFSSIFLKYPGDDAYYEMPASVVRDGVVRFSTIQTSSANKRNFAHSIAVEITWKYFAIDYTNLIGLLGLMNIPLYFKMTLQGGQTFNSAGIDATTGTFGIGWRYVNEGDANNEQYVEFRMRRRITAAEYQLMLAANPATGTPNVADNFYGLLSCNTSDIKQAGIRKIEWGGGSYSESSTVIRNARFIGETVDTEDMVGRNIAHTINLEAGCDLMDPSAAHLAELDGYFGTDMDFRLTLPDGTTLITLDSLLGMEWTVESASDAEDIVVAQIAGRGAIACSSTAWDAIWP